MTRHRFIGRSSRRAFLAGAGATATGIAVAHGLPTDTLAQDASATPKAGGTLTVAHIGDVADFDPLTAAFDLYQNYGRRMLFGSLTTYDADSTLIGDLATSWELDGTAWVFRLREGVTWHDGSPFSAEDVKYTFDRALAPETGSFAASYLGLDSTFDVIDPLTLRANLPAVNASYPDVLTGVGIVKKDSGDSNKNAPVGTGPFTFGSWTPNEQTVYVRNDNYYDPSRPLLDEVIFRPIPDPQLAITNLKAGNVGLVSNQLILPQTAQMLESEQGIKLIVVDPSTQLAYANLVQREPPLSDTRVRQGLAMCLDLETIKELVYAGRGVATNNFMTPLSWAYVDIPPYPYDPERAKELFAEAGFPDGFEVTIDAIQGYPDLIQIGSIWQDGLKKAGVEATPTTYEINNWLDRWTTSNYQISFNFDIQGLDPQRAFVADYLEHIRLEEWADQDLANTVTEKSAAAVATVDQEERKVIYAELQHLLFDELPVIPIFRPAMIAATSDKVEGLAIDGKGFYHFDIAWLNE